VDEPVTLARLAAEAGASPFHLQRTFTRELGLSPRDLTDAAKMNALKRKLRGGMSVTDAIYEAGFGSPSRVYERSARALGMTPRAYARGGAGVDVIYTSVPCRLGRVLVAATAHGVCAVKLGSADEELVRLLESEFPKATLDAGDAQLRRWTAAIVRSVDGARNSAALPLDIRGTAFQTRVWKALQQIPRGETRSYGAIARAIGRPTAARAVAQACGANPVCIAIPCHRVVQENGGLGGYHWGIDRKRALLEVEKK
jgi:AraC family transcriptional regulator of adaptative response/methylated-DNA-[protein]-cysteine methyltransferase